MKTARASPRALLATRAILVLLVPAGADRSGSFRQAALLPEEALVRGRPLVAMFGSDGALSQKERPHASHWDNRSRVLDQMQGELLDEHLGEGSSPTLAMSAVRRASERSIASSEEGAGAVAGAQGLRLDFASALQTGSLVGLVSAQAAQSRSAMIGLMFGPAKTILKLCAACVCFAVLLKMLGKIDCGGKKCDCRRWKFCARQLLVFGWDEFPGQEMTVKVHSVKGVNTQRDKNGNSPEYEVKIRFKWSKFETTSWPRMKKMEVPQGASECEITLYSLGWSKTCLGRLELETKKDILDMTDKLGKERILKLEKAGKKSPENVEITITFGAVEEEEEGGVTLEGVDPHSELGMEVDKVMEEMRKEPGCPDYVMLPAKANAGGGGEDDDESDEDGKKKGVVLEGQHKIEVLSRVLEGPLRTVDKKGKEGQKVYATTIRCNFSELVGDKDARKEEKNKQEKKRKEKGLTQLEEKWYWVWYLDRSSAKDPEKWHHPEGFIPMSTITSVHRSPENPEQFLIKYKTDKKDHLLYRRDTTGRKGKGRDVWVEGIDFCFREVQKLSKELKEKPAQEAEALARMRKVHEQFVAQRGMPSTQEEWRSWTDSFREKNYDDQLITKLYQEIARKQQAAAAAGKQKTRK